MICIWNVWRSSVRRIWHTAATCLPRFTRGQSSFAHILVGRSWLYFLNWRNGQVFTWLNCWCRRCFLPYTHCGHCCCKLIPCKWMTSSLCFVSWYKLTVATDKTGGEQPIHLCVGGSFSRIVAEFSQDWSQFDKVAVEWKYRKGLWFIGPQCIVKYRHM